MKNLWVPNVFVYNLVSFKALDCLKKLAGMWVVKDKDLFYNQVIGFVLFIFNTNCLRVANPRPICQSFCLFLPDQASMM